MTTDYENMIWNIDSYKEAGKNFNIIHYNGHGKPWRHPERFDTHYFWQYARETIFYEEISMENLIREECNKLRSVFTQYRFPYSKIEKGSKVVLYGAGKVGSIFKQQIDITRHCKIVAWIDKSYDQYNKMGMNVLPVDELLNVQFDFCVIAVENKSVSESIKQKLIEMKILEDRIVWEIY